MTLLISLIVFFSVMLLVLYLYPSKEKLEAGQHFRKRREELVKKSPVYALFFYFIGRIARYNRKLKIDRFRSRTRDVLNSAGNPGELTADEFLAIKEILVAVIGLLVILASGKFNLLLLLIFCGLAFFYPNYWLKVKISSRQKAISNTLPYTLDLLTLSVEAGLDFGMAVERVIENAKPGPLMEELFQMSQEVKMGKSRREALRAMANRNQLSDMSSFASALLQADRLGTSIGSVLRIQSDDLRFKRAQRAEELGAKAAVKMLFPLILFIFPALLIILLGPVMIQFIRGGF